MDETEQADFDAAVEGFAKNQLQPGDLCFMKPPLGRMQLAVYIGPAGTQFQYLLTSGNYCQIAHTSAARMTLPGFVSEEELESIQAALPKQHIVREGTGALPNLAVYVGEPPAAVKDHCKAIAKKLQEFDEEILEFRRSQIGFLDSLYERMAKDDEYVRVSFDRFIQALLGSNAARLSDAGRIAIFTMAMRSPTKIQLWHTGKDLHLEVLLGPKTLVRKMDQVVGWAREYQDAAALASKGEDVQHLLASNPITMFINKARKIILASRKLRSPTTIGCLGPSRQQEGEHVGVTTKPSGVQFSDSDRSILDFIYDTYIRQPRMNSRTKHHAIASLILRAIGAYPTMTLAQNIGRLLLQELGALAPWAEPSDDSVLLPIPGRRGADRATKQFAEGERLAAELGFESGSYKVPLPDSLAHIRKDLGQMQVFVIDSAGTDIPDDGVSIEACADRPGCYWMHVHVAHPSAFFDPHSLFGQIARTQGSSWYTPSLTYPMLPNVVSKAMSLAPGSATLTTSTLLDPKGNVLDIKIQPTRVHNVINLQPEAVEHLLGHEEKNVAVLIVGSDPSLSIKAGSAQREKEIEHARRYLPILERGMELLRSRLTARESEQKEVVNTPFEQTPHPNTTVSFLEEYRASRLYESTHYVGDPTIKLSGAIQVYKGRWADYIASQSFVAQFMVLAGESTAKWFRERSLPAVYVGSQTDPSYPVSKLNAASVGDLILAPRAVEKAEPVQHIMMAVEQYIRSTSPLRRFTDLLMQWNADAYLLAEASGVVQGGNPLPDDSVLPHPRAAVADYISYESWIAQSGRAMQADSDKHWAFQALFRAFHFKEAELPEIWNAQIRNQLMNSGHESISSVKGASKFVGSLHPFNHHVIFMDSEEGWELQATRGQYLPVKIEMVDATRGEVYCMPVGPPTNEPTLVVDSENGMVFVSKQRMEAHLKAEEEKRKEDHGRAAVDS